MLSNAKTEVIILALFFPSISGWINIPAHTHTNTHAYTCLLSIHSCFSPGSLYLVQKKWSILDTLLLPCQFGGDRKVSFSFTHTSTLGMYLYANSAEEFFREGGIPSPSLCVCYPWTISEKDKVDILLSEFASIASLSKNKRFLLSEPDLHPNFRW